MSGDEIAVWTSKVAEAYCVYHAIPCNRKYTDAELAEPMKVVRHETAQAREEWPLSL